MGLSIANIEKWLNSSGYLNGSVELSNNTGSGYMPDGVIHLDHNNQVLDLSFESRISVTERDIDTLVGRKARYGLDIVVAQYITKGAKMELWRNDIGFLDKTGELSYRNKEEGVLILITQPKVKNETKIPTAFSKNGLHLIYAVLKNPNLLNETYETITEETSIPKSTLGRLFKSLHSEGFIDLDSLGKRSIQKNLERLRQEWLRYCNIQLNRPPSRNDKPETIDVLKKALLELGS